jgi:hypothetical protein
MRAVLADLRLAQSGSDLRHGAPPYGPLRIGPRG